MELSPTSWIQFSYNETMKPLAWFTLVEMLVVLSVVALILWVSFRMSSSAVTDLKVKNDLAQFAISYNSEISSLLNTNYHGDYNFTEHITSIQPNTDRMVFLYTGTLEQWKEEIFSLNTTLFNKTFPDETWLTLTRKPYQIGCLINNDPQLETWEIEINTPQGSHPRCFTIFSDTCKLSQKVCQQ